MRSLQLHNQEMRLQMGLIEEVLEWAAGFAGIIGVFILLLFVGAGVFFRWYLHGPHSWSAH